MADATAGRIECANDLLSTGFVQVPILVLRDHDLSAGAKLVYGGLVWYLWRGGTYPGQVAMAEEFGIGERSVRRHLAELEAQGYLAVKRHGLGQANTYTILCPWEQNPDRPKWPVKAAKAAGQTGQNGRSILVQDMKDDKDQQQQQAPRTRKGAAKQGRAVVVDPDSPSTADGLTAELVGLGVAEDTARDLASEFPDRVRQWVVCGPRRKQRGKARDLPAFLVAAIRGGFLPSELDRPEEEGDRERERRRVAAFAVEAKLTAEQQAAGLALVEEFRAKAAGGDRG